MPLLAPAPILLPCGCRPPYRSSPTSLPYHLASSHLSFPQLSSLSPSSTSQLASLPHPSPICRPLPSPRLLSLKARAPATLSPWRPQPFPAVSSHHRLDPSSASPPSPDPTFSRPIGHLLRASLSAMPICSPLAMTTKTTMMTNMHPLPLPPSPLRHSPPPSHRHPLIPHILRRSVLKSTPRPRNQAGGSAAAPKLASLSAP